MYKVNDFFCGAGGMGLGFKQAGFEIAGAWDFDKYAVENYKANVGDHVQQAEITQMVGADIPDADVWAFGFPCTDISIAGEKAGMIKGETRSGLFYEVMRLLGEVGNRPKILLAENVKALRPLLPVLEEEYKKAGYRMYSTLLNSKYWGVPQNRERYFVVGVCTDIAAEFEFPKQQTEYVPKLKDILEGSVDEKYYIADHLVKRVLQEAEKRLDIKIAGRITRYKNDQMNRVYDTDGIAPTALVVSGGGREHKILEEAQSLFTTQQNEVAYACVSSYYKGISPSDVGNAKRTHIVEDNPFRVRKLTPREYARLQGFPDDFKQVVSNTQFYKQMGNAVTISVANAIATEIGSFLGSLSFYQLKNINPRIYSITRDTNTNKIRNIPPKNPY